MRFAVSPFYDFGATIVLWGNLGLSLFIGVLHFLAAWIKLKTGGSPSIRDACSEVRFPRFSHAFGCFLFNGMVLASTTQVLSVGSPAEIANGVLGLIICSAIVYLGIWVPSNIVHATFLVYQLQKRRYLGIFYPKGYWTPLHMTRMYGSFFGHMMGQYHQYGGYLIWNSLGVALLTAPSPPTRLCYLQYFALAVWLLSWAVGLLVFRPHRCDLVIILQVMSNAILGGMMLLNGVNTLNPDPTVVAVASSLSLVQGACSMSQLVYTGILIILENRVWQASSHVATTKEDELIDVFAIGDDSDRESSLSLEYKPPAVQSDDSSLSSGSATPTTRSNGVDTFRAQLAPEKFPPLPTFEVSDTESSGLDSDLSDFRPRASVIPAASTGFADIERMEEISAPRPPLELDDSSEAESIAPIHEGIFAQAQREERVNLIRSMQLSARSRRVSQVRFNPLSSIGGAAPSTDSSNSRRSSSVSSSSSLSI